MNVSRLAWFIPVAASGLLVHCVSDQVGPTGFADGGPEASTSDAGPADSLPGMDGAVVDTGVDAGPTCVVSTSGASGTLDNTFSTAALTNISNQFAANAIAIDATGRIYAAGLASSCGDGGQYDMGLVRLLPTGDIDTTFNPGNAPKCYSLDDIDEAYAIAIDSVGRIVVGGFSGHVPNHFYGSVIRLLPDGSLDTTFNGSGKVDLLGPDGGVAEGNGNGFVSVYGVAIGAGDKVLVTGTDTNGSAAFNGGYVARLTSGGALDLTFGSGGMYSDLGVHDFRGIVSEPSGGATVVGWNKASPAKMVLKRLDGSGALDSAFASSGVLTLAPIVDGGGGSDIGRSLIRLPNGKLLTAGSVNSAGLSGQVGVALMSPTGVLDPAFNSGGTTAFPNLNFAAYYMSTVLASLCDGTMFVAGYMGAAGFQDIVVAKLKADGTTDPGFGDAGFAAIPVPGNQIPAGMAQDPITGKLIVIGGTGGQTVVARVNP